MVGVVFRTFDVLCPVQIVMASSCVSNPVLMFNNMLAVVVILFRVKKIKGNPGSSDLFLGSQRFDLNLFILITTINTYFHFFRNSVSVV